MHCTAHGPAQECVQRFLYRSMTELTRSALPAGIDAQEAAMQALRRAEPCLWFNPQRSADIPATMHAEGRHISLHDTQAASDRFRRFGGLLARLFPELEATPPASE
ncbi:hypothetical protein C8E08_4662 [Paracidovorax citrulli]|uniref:Uncharacterized protein n=2 Tax=Paracidovorax citrulli TaxID=80869 RepID=A1TPW2_PARC0|nr:hypothetical protein Aave_2425 [Paracidovorax citrulli AAC00-1]PVY67227.1 hypothetical protein C8E08_4662 [Paracidovorax citrulli]REG68612.1 hypothetical protein C8E07_1729 [Paracidovorax citrulli]RLJ93167.1 hypothetical protein C8E06_1729 [Paracidovorax citrulli]